MKYAQLRFHFGRKCLAIRHRMLTEFFPPIESSQKQRRSRLRHMLALDVMMNDTAACIADYPIPHFSRQALMRKVWPEAGDTHAVGELGTVLGSVRRPDVGVAYFISWDKHPRLPTFIIEAKLERE